MSLIYNNFLKYRFLIIFLWVFIFLNPILFSGFGGDDSYNSQIYGGALSKNQHWFFDDWYGDAKGWFQGSGRVNFFIGIITKGLFNYIHNFYILKFILLLLISFNVLVFGKLLEALKLSSDKVFLTLLLIPVFFQIRSYHDPIAGFFLLIPFATTCIFLSVLFFLKENNFKKNIFLSFLFLNLALFTYEISLILIPIYLVSYFFHREKRFICILFPLYMFIIVLGAKINHYNLGIMSNYPNANIENFFNLKNYLFTYFFQFIAAFPLSWRFASSTSFAFINIGSIIFAILIYFYLKKFKINNIQNFNFFENAQLLLFCLIIIFLIPILPAFSGHNVDITNKGLGYGYIPVYIQYFGLAPILSGLFIFLLKKIHKKKIMYFIVFLIIFSFGLTYRSNYKILSAGRVPYLFTPQYISFFIPRFDEKINITENKLFIRNYNVPYDNLWNYTKAAKKLVNSCYLDNEFKNCLMNHEKKYGNKSEFYGTAYAIDGKDKQKYAILVKLKSAKEILDTIDYNILAFNEYFLINNYNTIISNKTSQLHDFYSIAKQGIFFNENLNLNNHEIENILIALKHFWPSEINGKNKLSWLSGDSDIILNNKNNHDIRGFFSFELIRPGTENISIILLDNKGSIIYKNAFSSGRHKVDIPMNLKSGINNFKLFVNGEIFKNGDPRKIKIGFSNWIFKVN